jgi:cell division septal protein FtsQ
VRGSTPPRQPPSHQGELRNPRPDALWWSLAALLVCLTGLATVVLGMFRIQHVEVVGAGLPASTIRQVAGVTDQNVFTVQSDQVVARLASIHEIVVGRVDTTFPDKVTIYAQERTPMVVWQTGKKRYELDPDGNVIRAVTVTTLPIIDGVVPQHGRIGPGIIAAVRYAVQTLPGVPNGTISIFHVGPARGLVIVGHAGWTAVIGRGSAQTLADRIATLASTLTKLQKRGLRLTRVDLRFPNPAMQIARP